MSIKAKEYQNGTKYAYISIPFTLDDQMVIGIIFDNISPIKKDNGDYDHTQFAFYPRFKYTRGGVEQEIRNKFKRNGDGWTYRFDEDKTTYREKWNRAEELAKDLFPDWFHKTNTEKFMREDIVEEAPLIGVISEKFSCHVSELGNGLTGYGDIKKDANDAPLKWVRVSFLLEFKDHRQVQAYGRNRAARLDKPELPSDTKIALYWH